MYGGLKETIMNKSIQLIIGLCVLCIMSCLLDTPKDPQKVEYIVSISSKEDLPMDSIRLEYTIPSGTFTKTFVADSITVTPNEDGVNYQVSIHIYDSDKSSIEVLYKCFMQDMVFINKYVATNADGSAQTVVVSDSYLNTTLHNYKQQKSEVDSINIDLLDSLFAEGIAVAPDTSGLFMYTAYKELSTADTLKLVALIEVVLVNQGSPDPLAVISVIINVEQSKLESTILFADGIEVTNSFDTVPYTNLISGEGTGDVTYSSSNVAIATVDSITGAVTYVAPGTAVITASKAATMTHTAIDESYTFTITIAPFIIAFLDGDTVYTLASVGTYINEISGIGDGVLTFVSDNPSVATVNISNGEVSIVGEGTANILVTKSATFTHAAISAEYVLNSVLILPSTIDFQDGVVVEKVISTNTYNNTVSGDGTGTLSYSIRDNNNNRINKCYSNSF